jgi:DNA invertase Pin-like site-specific DNA recombinase
MNAPTVTVIQPKIDLSQGGQSPIRAKKRVAAYARVSTDEKEQLSSYEAQIDFYTRHIKQNSDWIFVRVYTDEGISATNTKHRDGFNRMIADALGGKIDLILTKSVSRFARNTVDTLTTVRKLKEKGVEIYFEKENIYTMDSKGELLITIMSSLAQEESRSISENVRWGQHKRMADGKVTIPYGHFLGYEKGEDGLPQIVEEEARIVRRIYSLFLQGQTYRSIAECLTQQGIPTPSGKSKWSVSTVMSILRNEKYKGDALLQKKFTVDFLTKRTKVNEGEYPQYYVENSHPAIIPPETFDLAQDEIERRKALGGRPRCNSPFSRRVLCGECGGFYGSKVWHSKSERHRSHIWQCNNKYTAGTYCRTPHLSEEALEKAFVAAFKAVLGDKDRIVAKDTEAARKLAETADLEREEARLEEKLAACAELIRLCVDENARMPQNQSEYQNKYDELTAKYRAAQNRLKETTSEKSARRTKGENIRRFLDCLKSADGLPTEFDEDVWYAAAHTMTVYSEKDILVTFKDGREVRV